MFREAEEIGSRRPVYCVCAAIWDVEGIAFLVRRKFRLVTSLVTPLKTFLDSNPDKAADKLFVEEFATPVLQLEKCLMQESDGILADSEAIVEEMEQAYSFRFDRSEAQPGSSWSQRHDAAAWQAGREIAGGNGLCMLH